MIHRIQRHFPWRNLPVRKAPVTQGTTDAPSLSLDQVTVRYGEQTAIQNASFEVQPGQLMALVGPSGCGKSSLLASVNRMTDLVDKCQVSGNIYVGGVDIHAASVNLAQLRQDVGIVFQQPNPFPLSVAENICFPLREHGIKDKRQLAYKTEQALQAVGLWNEVKDRLDRPALALSGGQQQRLCFARTLALSPRVILLDEPCSALDPIAAGVVEDLICSLKGRYTLLMVTHNLAQARRVADAVSVCWVEQGCGCVVETGPSGVIFEQPSHPLTQAYCDGLSG